MIPSDQTNYIIEEFILHSNQHIFLTGKAGTGKTTLLRNILPKLHKNHVILAPTGIAAINAGGMTIHSFFQFPLVSFAPTTEYVDINIANNQQNIISHFKHNYEKIKIIRTLDLIIIDEASMVRCDMLDLIDFTLKHIRNNSLPFGGVQMLLIGDLYQLSPVIKDNEWNLLRNYYDGIYFFDSHIWKFAAFITYTLSHVFRQNDTNFISALNAIREGHITQNTLDYINAHSCQAVEPSDDYITLTTHNHKAHQINEQQLDQLPGPMICFEAKIDGLFSESAYPNEKSLYLKVGSKVMFIRNDAEGYYYNGLLGSITNMEDEKVTIDCEGKEINVGFIEWKNMNYSIDKDSQKITSNEIGSFAQLPLKPAWGVTVHKSQGLTFDKIKLDLSDSFAAGQVYVALSRARTLEGIQLTKPLTLSNIKIDPHVNAFYQNNTTTEIQLKEKLDISKDHYAIEQLMNVYHFEKLIINFHTLNDHVNSLITKKYKQKYGDLSKEMLDVLQELQHTALTFHKHLHSLINIKNNDHVIERCGKATVYYTDQLFNKCIIPIHAFINIITAGSKDKKWLSELKNYCTELWLKINELYDVQWQNNAIQSVNPYSKEMLENVQNDHHIGDTISHTHILFESGKSIAEIANIRALKLATIENHMKKLLAEGKVEILQLMPKERIDQLLPYFQSDGLKLSEMMISIPFETTYAELSWMRTWLNLSSNTQQ